MKNKKLFTRALSLMICMIMVLGSVAAGADGIESIFSEKAQAASVLDGKLLWPVSSSYSMTRPFSATGHKAVDINNCTGKDIVAAYDGTVYAYYNKCQHYSASCTSCEKGGYGVGLIIKHTINGTTYYTHYAHMVYNSIPQKFSQVGATVKQGEVIGKVGSSGNSTGPHLHFQVTSGANAWSNYINNTPTDKRHNYVSSSGISYIYSLVTSELEMFLNDSLYNYAYNSDFATLDKEHYRTRNSSKYELSVDPSEKIDGYNSLKIKALEAGADQKDLVIDTQLQNWSSEGYMGDNKSFVVSFFAKADVASAKIYWRWGGETTYQSISLTTDWEYYSIIMDKKPGYNYCLHPYIDSACTVWVNQFQVGDVKPFKSDSGKIVGTIKRKGGEKWGTLPTPTLSNYTFDGWYTEKIGGTKVTNTTAANAGLRVYAHWKKSGGYKVSLYNNYSEKNYFSMATDGLTDPINKYLLSHDSGTYRITVDDSNKFNNNSSIKIVGVSKGATYLNNMNMVTDTNFSNIDYGVGDEKDMVLSFYAKSTISGTKLYWRWGYDTEAKAVELSTDWQHYSVLLPKDKNFSHTFHPYFDTVGTVWLSQLQLEDGDAATDYVPETSGIFDEFTYSGSFSSSTLSSYVPVREGYDFDGWYTSKVGGTKVTSSNDVALGDVKLYAHWSKSACKHNYVVVADTEPTCLNDGSRTFKCSKCGDSYEEAVPAPGHKAGEWTVDAAATCTAAGKRVKYCTVCRAVVETETLPAKGHSFGEWKQGAASSCTSDGYEYRVCASCGFVENKNVSGTGHSWASEYTVDKAATCTENGSKSIHCTKCSATANSTVIPAKGHSFGNWRTLNEATCTADGSEIRNCSACSATEKRTVAAKGHIWQDDFTVDKEATCSETGSKSVHCRNCSATKYSTEIAKKPHNVVIDNSVAATCTTAGLTEGSHCLTCGTVIKARTTVPATGHTDMNNDGLCDKCGKSLAPTVYPKLSIRTPSTTTVSYGFTLNLHANVTDLPDGARIVWSMDGSGFELIPSADGMTCGVKSVSKGSATITAKVVDKTGNAVKDANGNEITASQQLTSKAGFFQKLAAFFKRLFGSNMVIPYALNKLMK